MSKTKELAKKTLERLKESKKVLGLTAAMIAFSPNANAQNHVKQDDLPKNNKELSLDDLKFVDPSTLGNAFDVKGDYEVASETLEAKPVIQPTHGRTVYATPSGYKLDIRSNTEKVEKHGLGGKKEAIIEKGDYTVNGVKKSGIINITIVENMGHGKQSVLAHVGLAEAEQAISKSGKYSFMETLETDIVRCSRNINDTDEGYHTLGEKRLSFVMGEMKKSYDDVKKIQDEHQMFLVTGKNSAIPTYEVGGQFSNNKKINQEMAMSRGRVME